MLMGIWGWWAFDIFTLIASYQGPNVIAAQTILRSIGLMTFMLPVGFTSAVSTLVGNSIGAHRPDLAKQYYSTCFVLGLGVSFVQVLILVIGCDSIVHSFTTHQDVIDQLLLAWPVLQIFVIFDTT